MWTNMNINQYTESTQCNCLVSGKVVIIKNDNKHPLSITVVWAVEASQAKSIVGKRQE